LHKTAALVFQNSAPVNFRAHAQHANEEKLQKFSNARFTLVFYMRIKLTVENSAQLSFGRMLSLPTMMNLPAVPPAAGERGSEQQVVTSSAVNDVRTFRSFQARKSLVWGSGFG